MANGVGAKAGKVMRSLFSVLATRPIVASDIVTVSEATKVDIEDVRKAIGVYERMGYVTVTHDKEGKIDGATATENTITLMSGLGVI